MASSHKFELLDEEVEGILDQITDKLQCDVRQCKSQEEQKYVLTVVDQLLKDASNSLTEMDIEIRKAPIDFRNNMNSKVLRYRDELIRHQQHFDVEKSSHSHLTNRSSLFSTTDDGYDVVVRKKVEEGRAILERTSASISRSTAVAIEAEQVGTEVLGELGTQRETLTRTRDRLVDTDEELSRSKRIIRSMSRNVLYNKILLVIIIVLEFVMLGAAIYWKFFM